MTFERSIASPLGRLRLVASDDALAGVHFQEHRHAAPRGASAPADHPVLERAARELAEYFSGSRRRFSVPLAPSGSEFQRAVWTELARIPFGETRSYSAVARALGRARAERAVGAAAGRNPLSIVIPCHRVLGSDGALTGYAGGLDAKRWLLDHERAGAPVHGASLRAKYSSPRG
jgi:methylated-DNA-[protein]-cysteine S-methyltransferase